MTSTGLATGLGALSGSGVLRPNGNFNLQGAIMGGALAYGASNLAQGLQEAGKATTATDELVKSSIGDTSSALSGTGSAAVEGSSRLTPTANALQNIPADFVPPSSYVPPVDSAASFAPAGEYGLKNLASNPVVPSGEFGFNPAVSSTAANQLGTSAPVGMLDKVASSISNLPGNIADSATSAFDTLTSPQTYSNIGTKLSEAGSGTLSNVADAGVGIKNLVTGAASVPASMTMMNTAVPLVMGASGLAALEEQQKYLDSQLAAGNIAQEEYNKEKASIDAQVEIAKKAVAENPLKSSADISSITNEPTTYAKNTNYDTLYDKNPTGGSQLLYALGGSVQANPPDDQTGVLNRSPMTNFNQPGIMSMIDRTVPQQMYARGGEVQHYEDGGFLSFKDVRARMRKVIEDQKAAQDAQAAAAAKAAEAEKLKMDAGEQAVKANPLRTRADVSGITALTNTLPNVTLYVNNPINDAYDLNRNNKRSAYAAGGQFLSGGGDGMSDSIRANINGNQEARLADGEFVIPADVVSHLGNGSSKAGAKQLYSMMDKVRKARTGTKKQGKQINPRKYLAA